MRCPQCGRENLTGGSGAGIEPGTGLFRPVCIDCANKVHDHSSGTSQTPTYITDLARDLSAIKARLDAIEKLLKDKTC